MSLDNVVTVARSAIGRRVTGLAPERLAEVCRAMEFALGCDEALGLTCAPYVPRQRGTQRDRTERNGTTLADGSERGLAKVASTFGIPGSVEQGSITTSPSEIWPNFRKKLDT